MMFEDLKRNLEQEKKIAADMRAVALGMQGDAANSDFYMKSLQGLAQQLDVLNNVVPELLKEWSATDYTKVDKEGGKTPVAVAPAKKKTVKVSYVEPGTKEKKMLTIKDKDKKKFLKKLKLSDDALKNVKGLEEKRASAVVKKANPYAGFSNKVFLKTSEGLAPSFDGLGKDLKRSNIHFLLSTYISMAIMSTILAFLFGGLIFGGLMLISFSNWIFIFLPFGFAGLVLAGFYMYPASEASTVQKNISYELPFATIHMSAIAGSNIEPVKIFKIIGASEEYPSVGTEIKKVITQVEIYGYDLVTALKNVSVRIPNKRLAELFSGLATNISTGGALKNYLEKKSENFLVDYRLERQKYSALAGTFMDVYISLLIAAPLVLMMMFIVMNVSGLGFAGISIQLLLLGAVFAIAVVNIIFLFIINAKQPKV
ncbi:hypothetical protein HNV12_00720 [Methanococcoides sp. SA1]|nr:hypothetical protein [Methanococcoides sp. SA1]